MASMTWRAEIINRNSGQFATIYDSQDWKRFSVFPYEKSMLRDDLIARVFRFDPKMDGFVDIRLIDRHGTLFGPIWRKGCRTYLMKMASAHGEFAWLLDLCLEAGLDIPGMARSDPA